MMENMTSAEFKHAVMELISLTTTFMGNTGYDIKQPNMLVGAMPASNDSPDTMLGSSVMTREEQQRFFETNQGQR